MMERFKTVSIFCDSTDNLELSFNEAKQVRRVYKLSGLKLKCRQDVQDLKTLLHPESHRICRGQSHEDGLLLPFGYSRKEYVTPNPTLFSTEPESWLLNHDDPFEGWSFPEILAVNSGRANKDDYGKPYCYLSHSLRKLHGWLSSGRVSITVLNKDASALPQHIGEIRLNRIEVSTPH